MAFDQERVVGVSALEGIGDKTHGCDAGKRRHTFQRLPIKRLFLGSRLGNREARNQGALGAESGIDGLDAKQASHQQTSAAKKHHRHRELADDQRVAQSAAAGPDGLAATAFFEPSTWIAL
jgi:hypothetical protein